MNRHHHLRRCRPSTFSLPLLLTLLLLLPGPDLSAEENPAPATPPAPATKPNVILILADDMGFSDLGCYGSEIETPNLDALAKGGMRFTQFYNNARCCPTRASLMTGLTPHQAGIGHMTEEPGQKYTDPPAAYQGHLNQSCTTLAEVMRSAGYTTLMTGKWHLGGAQREDWPLQRGFDQYYGCLAGAMFYFHPKGKRGITEGNEPVTELKPTRPETPYYTTDAFTDYAIRYTGQAVEQKKPFFLYLAYNAPHWPLQAPEKDIAKYKGRYAAGWDALRQARYDRQVKLGLIDPKWPLSPRDPEVPAWDTLPADKQADMQTRMEVYAAMVDRLDQNVGRLVASLKERGVFENTLILFLSDNGACAEGGTLGNYSMSNPGDRENKWDLAYGKAWANLSSTPFRLYKHFAQEGGVATPFIAHWPAGIQPHAGWFTAPAQIIDFMPTLVELSGATYPQERNGQPIPTLPGVSLLPAFRGSDAGDLKRPNPLFMEHENNAYIRQGDWKLEGRNVATPAGIRPGRWQLYNLAADRTELKNLAPEMPDKVQAMAKEWQTWANAVKVYPKPGGKKKDTPAQNDQGDVEDGE